MSNIIVEGLNTQGQWIKILKIRYKTLKEAKTLGHRILNPVHYLDLRVKVE